MATKWISPTWRMPEESNQSKFENYSLNFDGTNAYIQAATSSDAIIDFTNPWSISWWAKWDYSPGFDCFWQFGSTTSPIRYIIAWAHSTGIGYSISNSASVGINYNIANGLNDGNWHNIVFTGNGNTSGTDPGIMNVYVDGVLNTDTTSPTGLTSFSSTMNNIGRGVNTTNRYFNGSMDQLAIFDYQLDSDQISYLYNSGTPVNPMALTPLPTAYYPLGGGSTGDAADPATTLTVPNESVPSATVFDFDASDDYINAGSLSYITSNVFTISGWIKATTSPPTYMPLFNFQNSSGIGSKFNWNHGAAPILWYSGSTYKYFLSGSWRTDGLWHNVVLVIDRTTIGNSKLYVDGDEISGGTTSGSGSMVLNDLNLGYNPTTQFYDGEMSNVAIWNSDQTVNKDNIYNNGIPQSTYTTNPEAWYKLNVDEIWENVAQQWRVKNNQITPINYDRAGQSNLAYGGTYFNYVTTTNLTQSRTISLWIKYDINRQTGTLRVGFFNDPSLTFYTTGFRESNQASSGVVTFTVPGINVSDGGWHHILLHTIGDSADASNIAYIDGQLATRSVIGTNSYTFGNPGVGYGNKGGNLPPAAYSFSNLVMYNGDATSNVNALYNNGTPPADVSSTTPDVWWKTNSTNSSVTTLEDFSGNNNDSTTTYTQPVNMVTDNWIAESGISSGMTTANLVNSDLTRSIPYSSYSMEFDGTDDYIDCGPGFQYTNVTVSCWVNFNTLGSFDRLLQTGVTGGGIGVLLTLDNSAGGNKITAGWGDATTDDTVISTSDVVVDTWYNVTFTRNASGIKIYINGIDVSGGTSPGFSYGASNNLELGRKPGGSNNLDGNLSNVAIFNSVLSEDQIITIYNGGAPNDISGLAPASWWSLSGDSYFNGNDWICPDLGSNGSDGTSDNMGGTELVGDGPGSTANGIATSMDIPTNLKGNAPNSTSNAFSINMNSADRVEDVAPTP